MEYVCSRLQDSTQGYKAALHPGLVGKWQKRYMWLDKSLFTVGSVSVV